MQLEFSEQQNAKLKSLNIRTEMHGDAHVTAADLNLSFKLPNDRLAYFHPTLKHSLYEKDDAAQGELMDDPHHLTKLRFPQMKNSIKWDWSGIGYTLRVAVGISNKDDVIIGDCKVVKPEIDPQDGGTIILDIQVQCRPAPGQLGQLSEMLSNDILVTLTAPEASDVSGDKPLFDSTPSGGAPKPSSKRSKPTGEEQLSQAAAGLAATA